jgi:hypothetical protein
MGMLLTTRRGVRCRVSLGAAVALAAAGCAGSANRHPIAAAGPPAAAAARPAAPPRLTVISPRRGHRVDENVKVIVRVSGALHERPRALRFLLDGRRLRETSTRFTLRGLRPGHHRLLVSLVANRAVRAASSFVVGAPARAPTPARGRPSCCTTTAVAAPEPPAPTTASVAPPATTTAAAPPPPTSTAVAPPNGIPQGNGGDMDGDNNGGPSDGDGNV